MKTTISNIAGIALISVAMQASADHREELQLEEIQVSAPANRTAGETPGVVEAYNAKQIRESINATTSAQAVKYLPSLQVRERYIGDRNGIIASRTAGTLSSAQTLMYADGILLSNLLGNSFAFPPRWGLVSPDEIDHVDVMYGPYSALYAGNSMGGVVNITTRMPSKFEAHASIQAFQQNFKLYGTDEHFRGSHFSAYAGDRVGDFSFWIGADHLENDGQPMDFVVRDASAGNAAAGGIVVTGADRDKGEKGQSRVVFGAVSMDQTVQDNAKLKLAYDITPDIRAAYTLGIWQLDSESDVQSYLRDAAGNPVFNSRVRFDDSRFNITGLSPSESEALHVMQAMDVRSDSKGFFDWQASFSDYDYQRDRSSASIASTATDDAALGNPYINKAGRVVDMAGTGWRVFDLRGTWRPEKHTVDVGYHIDQYALRSKTFNTADWKIGSKGALNAGARGDTRTQALYAQDKWQINPQWALTTGGRLEYWQAFDGRNLAALSGTLQASDYDEKSETKFSPKVGLAFEPVPEWGFRAALGKAYRFPTVSELYQAITSGPSLVENNPDLKPEMVYSGELTAERRFGSGLVRATLFQEDKYDALISQTISTGVGCAGVNCTFIQNVDKIRTRGIELATQWQDVGVHGLDFMGSLTLTDAKILRNESNPETEGNKAVRIPVSTAKAVFTYHHGSQWTHSLGMRYSGRQYNALDNSDINEDTYIAASKFFFVDLRSTYRFADRWTAALGIDNLNDYKAYVRHPYPQRTAFIQVKFDY
ncbi:putative TonB-dependent receptor BfrD [Methylophilaceae bacterium]|nr:putative TonB-dependent receptor BfrD [Methylophilaceae bacterium]